MLSLASEDAVHYAREMSQGHEAPDVLSAVLFDLDGTLVDSSEDLARAVNAALQDLGLPPRTHADVVTFVGDGARELVRLALPEDHRDQIDSALELFREHYRRALLVDTRPYPGVPEMLDVLAPLPLAVVSNKPEELAQAILEGLGLAKHFALVIGGDSLKIRKPDPRVLLAALDRLGVRPSNALVVGDGVQDVEAARRAGIPSCGVAWGYRGRAILEAAGAEQVIDRPSELAAVVMRRTRLSRTAPTRY